MGANILGHMDVRRYNPSRDIAYVWQNICQVAFDGLAEDQWDSTFSGYLRHCGVTEAEIGEACAAYAKFFNICRDPECKYPVDALKQAGFLDLHPAAQAALMIQLGRVLTGAFFVAIRDVTIEGEADPLNDRAIREAAENARRKLSASLAWRRTVGWVARTARSFRSLFRKG